MGVPGTSVYVHANGATVGIFLSAAVLGSASETNAPLIFNTNWWYVLSDTGYVFAITPADRSSFFNGRDVPGEQSAFDELWFDGPDCSGQAYVFVDDGPRQAMAYQGWVATSLDVNDPIPLYYVAKGSTPVTGIVAPSRREAGGCEPVPLDSTLYPVVPAYPNDQLITGVPDGRVLAAPVSLSPYQ